MAITLHENPAAKLLEVQVTEKFTHADYQQFAVRFEAMLERHGKLNLLFQMAKLHGWDAAVVWDDIKFDAKHFSDIRRLAMVGETKWEKAMSVFARPFTTGEVRYFEADAIEVARVWAAGE